MFGRLLTAAAVAAIALPMTLAATGPADAKPKWKHGGHGHHGWAGGPPAWAPAHGYRRKHARWGGYGYRRSYDRYGDGPPRHSRW